MGGRKPGSKDRVQRKRRTKQEIAAERASNSERDRASQFFRPHQHQRSQSAPANVGGPPSRAQILQEQNQRQQEAQNNHPVGGASRANQAQGGGAAQINIDAPQFEVGNDDHVTSEDSYHARYLKQIKSKLGGDAKLREKVKKGLVWFDVGVTKCPIAETERTQIRSGLNSDITPVEFYKPRVRIWYAEHSI